MPVRLDVKKQLDITLVTCLDIKLNDELAIQEWGEQLTDVLDNGGCKKLVVNFENVKFLSSSALRILIVIQKKCAADDIPFMICGLREEILEIFRITNLDKLFNIRKGTEEAIRSFPYLGLDIPN